MWWELESAVDIRLLWWHKTVASHRADIWLLAHKKLDIPYAYYIIRNCMVCTIIYILHIIWNYMAHGLYYNIQETIGYIVWSILYNQLIYTGQTTEYKLFQYVITRNKLPDEWSCWHWYYNQPQPSFTSDRCQCQALVSCSGVGPLVTCNAEEHACTHYNGP